MGPVAAVVVVLLLLLLLLVLVLVLAFVVLTFYFFGTSAGNFHRLCGSFFDDHSQAPGQGHLL